MNENTPAKLVPARFGQSGTKVHLSYGWYTERHGRIIGAKLMSTVPECGTYTRPGAGLGMTPDTEITCDKCKLIERDAEFDPNMGVEALLARISK